jgi:hypothetical protein
MHIKIFRILSFKSAFLVCILCSKFQVQAQNEGPIVKFGGSTNTFQLAYQKNALLFGGGIAIEGRLKKRSSICFHADLTGRDNFDEKLLTLGAQIRNYSKTVMHGFFWVPDASFHKVSDKYESAALASLNLTSGYQADLSKKVSLNLAGSVGLVAAFKNFNPVPTWRLELQIGFHTDSVKKAEKLF